MTEGVKEKTPIVKKKPPKGVNLAATTGGMSPRPGAGCSEAVTLTPPEGHTHLMPPSMQGSLEKPVDTKIFSASGNAPRRTGSLKKKVPRKISLSDSQIPAATDQNDAFDASMLSESHNSSHGNEKRSVISGTPLRTNEGSAAEVPVIPILKIGMAQKQFQGENANEKALVDTNSIFSSESAHTHSSPFSQPFSPPLTDRLGATVTSTITSLEATNNGHQHDASVSDKNLNVNKSNNHKAVSSAPPTSRVEVPSTNKPPGAASVNTKSLALTPKNPPLTSTVSKETQPPVLAKKETHQASVETLKEKTAPSHRRTNSDDADCFAKTTGCLHLSVKEESTNEKKKPAAATPRPPTHPVHTNESNAQKRNVPLKPMPRSARPSFARTASSYNSANLDKEKTELKKSESEDNDFLAKTTGWFKNLFTPRTGRSDGAKTPQPSSKNTTPRVSTPKTPNNVTGKGKVNSTATSHRPSMGSSTVPKNVTTTTTARPPLATTNNTKSSSQPTKTTTSSSVVAGTKTSATTTTVRPSGSNAVANSAGAANNNSTNQGKTTTATPPAPSSANAKKTVTTPVKNASTSPKGSANKRDRKENTNGRSERSPSASLGEDKSTSSKTKRKKSKSQSMGDSRSSASKSFPSGGNGTNLSPSASASSFKKNGSKHLDPTQVGASPKKTNTPTKMTSSKSTPVKTPKSASATTNNKPLPKAVLQTVDPNAPVDAPQVYTPPPPVEGDEPAVLCVAKKFEYDFSKSMWSTVRTLIRVPHPNRGLAQGGMRACFEVYEVFDNGLSASMVAKMFRRNILDVVINDYFNEVEAQMMCQLFAKAFNAAATTHIKASTTSLLHYLDCNVVQIDLMSLPECQRTVRKGFFSYKTEDTRECFFTMEPKLQGHFTKYSGNNGVVYYSNEKRQAIKDHNSRLEVVRSCEAFSHFSLVESGGAMLVCDLQGVKNYLTDPQIHTHDGSNFGMGNMGEKGILWWLSKHKCNDTCKALKLPDCTGKTSVKIFENKEKREKYLKYLNDIKRLRSSIINA